jgi:hypothetical protein
MSITHRSIRVARCAASAATILTITLGVATRAAAQRGHEPREPLVLEAQGSFFVGGHTIHTDALTGDSTGGLFPPNEGSVTVDQMYVQYSVPKGVGRRLPVVMVHGGTLTGKTYETTPDGRMGWGEYLVRKHRPVYIVDQVSRGRSGFNATIFNEVKLGFRPPSQLPSILRLSHETSWTWFRFGPTFGKAFPDEQFPVQAFAEFGKQAIPDLNAMLPPTDNPTWHNLARLANRLRGAILLGHSQSAFFPERAAFIDPTNIKGAVSLETGFCPASFAPDQIAILTRIPILVVFGDHLEDARPPFNTTWTTSLENCRALVRLINDAGGDATLVHLPEIGIHGNSHMMMQDKNNLQVADVILRWIDRHVERDR